MSLAPIVLFVYARPDHTAQTLDALKANEEAASSELIIYSDAPANDSAKASVEKTRQLIASLEGFQSVTVVQQQQNRGLAASIIQGVTETLAKYEKVIVVEDDLVTSPYFLRFMNDALDRFVGEEDVASVHGYKYPTGVTPDENYFLNYVDSWGWGTWRDRWSLFNADGESLLREIRQGGLKRRFDFDGTYPFSRMLEDQIAGKADSWAIRWYASLFLCGKLSFYPRYSLVNSIGLDASGVHCSEEDAFYETEIHQEPIPVESIRIEESTEMRAATTEYFRRVMPTLLDRIVSKLKRLFR